VTGWVQDGTLLGLIRDDALIPWDHDTDTGVLITDWRPEAEAALHAAGFRLTGALGAPENGLQHRWKRAGEKTDIFFHYLDGRAQWHAAYEHSRQWRYYYPRFGLEAYRTPLGVVRVPSPPESFLEAKYGADWRTPKRRWHFARDPKNGRRA
jgi:lipopolysaccharide cholinephosphotransferase